MKMVAKYLAAFLLGFLLSLCVFGQPTSIYLGPSNSVNVPVRFVGFVGDNAFISMQWGFGIANVANGGFAADMVTNCEYVGLGRYPANRGTDSHNCCQQGKLSGGQLLVANYVINMCEWPLGPNTLRYLVASGLPFVAGYDAPINPDTGMSIDVAGGMDRQTGMLIGSSVVDSHGYAWRLELVNFLQWYFNRADVPPGPTPVPSPWPTPIPTPDCLPGPCETPTPTATPTPFSGPCLPGVPCYPSPTASPVPGLTLTPTTTWTAVPATLTATATPTPQPSGTPTPIPETPTLTPTTEPTPAPVPSRPAHTPGATITVPFRPTIAPVSTAAPTALAGSPTATAAMSTTSQATPTSTPPDTTGSPGSAVGIGAVLVGALVAFRKWIKKGIDKLRKKII